MLMLWIFSLAASFLLPATGELGSNFEHCADSFLDGKPPNLVPSNPARICQYFRGRYRFATMYDRDGRIPMFSAYKYHCNPAQTQVDWKIEPELSLPGEHLRNSMESERTCDINPRELAKGQAVSDDYTQAFPYDKGQLVPASHQQDQNNKAATYTLTNVVPLFQDLMNGEWDNFLSGMSKSTTECQDTYVIVGVVPSDNSISAGRVNKPSHIWAAVCCLTQKEEKMSWGVIAENNQNSVKRVNLKDLESELNQKYGKTEINLFHGACYDKINNQ